QCIAQSTDEEFSMLSANWVNDLDNVLKDVLSSPTLSSTLISPLMIQGNNIVWSEVRKEIQAKMEKQLNQCGFGIRDEKLVVVKPELVGMIDELPEALKKVLKRHIALHYPHYTNMNENRVDQTPRWLE